MAVCKGRAKDMLVLFAGWISISLPGDLRLSPHPVSCLRLELRDNIPGVVGAERPVI